MDLELGLNPMVILLGCLSDCPCFSTVSLGSWIVNCLPLNSAQICNVACWGPDFKAACQWFPSMCTRTDPGLSKPGSNPITQHVWTLGTVWSGSTMFTRCYTARGLVNVQSSYGSFNLPNFVQHQQTTCLMSELSCSSDPNSKDLHFSEEVYLNLASLTLCSSWWCGEKRVPPTSRQIIRNMCPELTLA